MTSTEKLRSMLKEARGYIADGPSTCPCGRCDLVRSIDAALAEPVAPAEVGLLPHEKEAYYTMLRQWTVTGLIDEIKERGENYQRLRQKLDDLRFWRSAFECAHCGESVTFQSKPEPGTYAVLLRAFEDHHAECVLDAKEKKESGK